MSVGSVQKRMRLYEHLFFNWCGHKRKRIELIKFKCPLPFSGVLSQRLLSTVAHRPRTTLNFSIKQWILS